MKEFTFYTCRPAWLTEPATQLGLYHVGLHCTLATYNWV